jgi:histidine ammonia-lyase
MADDLGKVLALELYTAAQALDLRRDMIEAARRLAGASDAEGFARKVHGDTADAAMRATFLAEVDGLRGELAAMPSPQPGNAVAAAHAAIRKVIPFLDRDRELGGEVATALRLVAEGTVLAAAKAALSD